MAAAAINQVYLVTVNGLLHGQRTMSSFYYQLFGIPAGAPTVEQAYDDLNTQMSVAADVFADYRAIAPTNWTFTESWVQCVRPQRYRKKVYVKNQAGLGPNASSVTNVSVSITREGELASRNRLGGIRIPLSPLDVTAGIVNAGPLAAANALATDLLTGYGAPGQFQWTPGFLSTILQNPPLLPTFEFTPNFAVFAQPTARVVRRRTVGVGI